MTENTDTAKFNSLKKRHPSLWESAKGDEFFFMRLFNSKGNLTSFGLQHQINCGKQKK